MAELFDFSDAVDDELNHEFVEKAFCTLTEAKVLSYDVSAAYEECHCLAADLSLRTDRGEFRGSCVHLLDFRSPRNEDCLALFRDPASLLKRAMLDYIEQHSEVPIARSAAVPRTEPVEEREEDELQPSNPLSAQSLPVRGPVQTRPPSVVSRLGSGGLFVAGGPVLKKPAAKKAAAKCSQ